MANLIDSVPQNLKSIKFNYSSIPHHQIILSNTVPRLMFTLKTLIYVNQSGITARLIFSFRFAQVQLWFKKEIQRI